MTTLSIEEMVDEIMDVHEYVLTHYGYRMYLFRPPEGHFSVRSLAVTQSLGYTFASQKRQLKNKICDYYNTDVNQLQ